MNLNVMKTIPNERLSIASSQRSCHWIVEQVEHRFNIGYCIVLKCSQSNFEDSWNAVYFAIFFILFHSNRYTIYIFTSSMHSTQITICVACSSNIGSETHTKNNERLQSKWFEIKTRLKCFEIWIWFQLLFFLCSDCKRQVIFIICCFSTSCHCLRYFDRYDILWNKFWIRNAMFTDHCVIKTRSKT